MEFYQKQQQQGHYHTAFDSVIKKTILFLSNTICTQKVKSYQK